MEPAHDSTPAPDPSPSVKTSAPRAASNTPEGVLQIVSVSGDLDRDSAPDLRVELIRAIGLDGVATVVVDCTRVAFCDSSGLNTLLRARLIALEAGVELRLAAPSRQLARLLAVTGVDEVLPVDEVVPGSGSPERMEGSVQGADGASDDEQ
ncbi:STAS domain-containing protein [Kitasatospora purpeofusca]|uniref:STAS domain-containing protein n=1 Tax=Kitasatospora purpeofusca TaxID=67352 RepID=UPI0036AEDEEA